MNIAGSILVCLAVSAHAVAAEPATAPAAKPAGTPAAVTAAVRPAPARPAARPAAPAAKPVATPSARGPAVIETVVGVVWVEARPGAKKVQATVGMGLPEGSMVTTSRNGRVFLRLGATDLVRLKEDSQIWIAQLRGWKPTRTSTLLQLVTGTMRAMLNRTGAEKVQNFGVVAGSTVCAVKGTMFDMLAPNPGAIAGKVEIRCDEGAVGVGTVKADDDLATYSIGTARVGVLKTGYSVAASAVTGKIELARRVPPRTTLEVVGGTGQVTAVVAGRTVAVQPGDEVPPGSKITVTGGSAVLVGTKAAVQATDGSSFSYEARTQEVKGVGPVVTSVVTVTAGSAVVDSGGRTATLAAGSAAVVAPNGTLTPMTAAQAAAVLNPPPPTAAVPGQPKPQGRTAPAVATAPEPAGTSEPAFGSDEVLPELPALPPESEVAPPPATPGQDTQTVTPPGTGEENPVSPSQPKP